jgi:hypothetical protein
MRSSIAPGASIATSLAVIRTMMALLGWIKRGLAAVGNLSSRFYAHCGSPMARTDAPKATVRFGERVAKHQYS